MSDVEVTIRYATTADSLADAWAFVMDRVDGCGPDPRIEIAPTWFYGNDAQEDGVRVFSVLIEGMVSPAPVRSNQETDNA